MIRFVSYYGIVLALMTALLVVVADNPSWAKEEKKATGSEEEAVEAENGALGSMVGKEYFLSCNLHADPVLKKISSVNYQLRGGLVPWGTPVTITRVLRNKLLFKDLEADRAYSYEFHWKTRRATSLVKHIQRIFVEDVSSLKKKVDSLSEKDKDGIYNGKVTPGMSREAVVIAMGYPPEFANPEPMKAREWHYWRSRWSRIVVAFNRKGLVSEIIGSY